MGVTCLGVASHVHAGGFELPDNGTEALGRGGAFVAKADDGTALQYNIAGLAQQRGTRITLNGNLFFHDTLFTRAGTYAGDPNDPRTPYAGQPFPTIRDNDRFFASPFIAVSTDFGWFRRWTFGFGLYAPSSIGRHNFGVPPRPAGATEDPPAEATLPNGTRVPGPARYDVARTDLIILYPTIAAAVRPVPWFDVGAAFQLVYSRFDLSNANVTPLPQSACPTPEYEGCDAYGEIRTRGLTAAALASVLFHPTRWLDVGATFRTPITIRTRGTLHPTAPPVLGSQLEDVPVTFESRLPLWVRVGARFVGHYGKGEVRQERWDIEANFVYEAWRTERASRLFAANFPLSQTGRPELIADIAHNYRDTYGVRIGGAYNFRLPREVFLTGRLGYYFDSAATLARDTRLDFNTHEKYGFTGGLGVRWSGFTFNVAYAYVYSPPRTVTDSQLRALSSFNGSQWTSFDPVVIVGNGRYEPKTQILSLGVTIQPDAFKRRR